MPQKQATSKAVPKGIWIAAAVALAFGALTIVSGGRALFGASAARAAAGDAVPFVLSFNFLSGFAYMAIGLGISLRKAWANWAAIAMALAIVAVFALLGWHILQGNPYEMRTVGAMILRAGTWITIALYLRGLAAKPHLKPNRNGRRHMTYGKKNIVAGLFLLAAFMLYGFGLIYLRDFAPSRAQWIADYSTGTHFESRLAHVHGNLFALLNIMIGYLILKLPLNAFSARWISWLGLAGMLMPVGIVAEFAFGAPFYLVLVGAISIIAAMIWLGAAVWQANISQPA